jgi:tetratricopeptide (TPR) repeat protein
MNRLLSVFAALVLAVAGCSFAHAQSQNSSQKDGAAQQGKQGQGGQQGGQGAASQAETQAFQEIQSELDSDKQIQLVNDFEKKYPDSKGLPFAYLVAAEAYRQKGDVERVVEYGEKSIKLKDDNPVALLLVASVLPEPQSLRGNGLDKEKKLSEAEEYANRAIKLIDQIPKLANLTDEQFQKGPTGELGAFLPGDGAPAALHNGFDRDRSRRTRQSREGVPGGRLKDGHTQSRRLLPDGGGLPVGRQDG